MHLFLIFLSSMILVFYTKMGVCQTQANPEPDEIQVLIDVSGSMKQNDPSNQRREASKLLLQLLPKNAKVSLWLFAEDTKEFLHTDAVNSAWQAQAEKALSKGIHSNGVYTNIENAIKTSLDKGFTGNGKKNLILLTDGIVDIAKDIMVSADSRERIFSDWIPVLQQRAVNVQTIALSNQADKELLNKLALTTGGWAEQAESAEQLQKVFIKMLLKAAPKDSVPLTDNHFLVDGKVKEFSLLVFKKPGSAPSKLLPPGEKPIEQSSSFKNVAWLASPNYDLITVQQPKPGDWQLAAEVDPDNQVFIVTDLQMHSEQTSNFVTETDNVPIRIYFTDQEKLIERDDFLKLITITASLDHQTPQNLNLNPQQKGYFSTEFNHLPLGKHQIKVLANSQTFTRDLQKEFEVIAEPIHVETEIDQAEKSVTLSLIPDTKIIDVATMTISATISQAGSIVDTQTIQEKDGKWLLKLSNLSKGKETLINVSVLAKSPDGHAMAPTLKPIKLDDGVFASQSQEQPADEHQSVAESEAEPNAEIHADEEASEENTTEDSESTDIEWQQVILIVVLANVILVVAAYYLVQAFKKSRLAKQQQLLEKLS